MHKTRAFIAVSIILAAGSTTAQDLRDNDWQFNFFNDSSAAIVELSTVNPNGQLSNNWLDGPLMPGTGLTMGFYDPNDTRCEVQTIVVFGDGATFDYTVNYCGIGALFVTDQGMHTD